MAIRNPVWRSLAMSAVTAAFWSQNVMAQNTSGYSFFGTPGLIDMPSAHPFEDAELGITLSNFAGNTRTTLSFQITPRLTGSFRYSEVDNFFSDGRANLDRSFDLQYLLIKEGQIRPAVAVGLRDFVGTGIYASEYVVASKHVTPKISVTGGIGWGRLGSFNSFENPLGSLDARFNTRPRGFSGNGGRVEADRWFRGEAALFGGISWTPTDKLRLTAEYSSDAYTEETGNAQPRFTRRSPLNFGATYKFANGVQGHLAWLYGDTLGAGITIVAQPRRPTPLTVLAPSPVGVRASADIADLGWTDQADGPQILQDNMRALLALEDVQFEAMRVEPTHVTLHVRNEKFRNDVIAVGRAARVLTRVMPASVEEFHVVLSKDGLPASKVVINRTAFENLEYAPNNAQELLKTVRFEDAADSLEGAQVPPDLYPDFTWSFGPFLSASYFDPESPVRVGVGLQLAATYQFAPGWAINGRLRQLLGGNIDDTTRNDPSALPRVRTDTPMFDQQGDLTIPELTLSWHARPGRDLYSRVTAGYLEQQYGGVSAELLWKPVDSRLALGAEVNFVKQRDFDQRFGFQDLEATTGHLSAYYDLSRGYHVQVDVGRYLAGDIGATFTLDRVFANGWRVGAYATFTDVSFEDFGEGSFDKGIRLTIPLESIGGTPTRRRQSTVLNTVTRDGGARVFVSDRLYEKIRDTHQNSLEKGFGQVWQ